MDRYKPSIGSLFVVIITIALVMAPPQANVTQAAGQTTRRTLCDTGLFAQAHGCYQKPKYGRLPTLSPRKKSINVARHSDFFPSLISMLARPTNPTDRLRKAVGRGSRQPMDSQGKSVPAGEFTLSARSCRVRLRNNDSARFTGGKLSTIRIRPIRVDFSAIQFEWIARI
jgi:hypothetical protein